LLAKTETRLTDLGIGGKIFRLSPLRNVAELINDEIRSGVKTIVIVGNDKTLNQIINLAVKFEITIGLIPVGEDNKIAKALGIASPEEACNILSSRKIERLDLGKANDVYFISEIAVSSGAVTIECENKFKVNTKAKDLVKICNLSPLSAPAEQSAGGFNPQDGVLEIMIHPLKADFWQFLKKGDKADKSVIPFKKAAIKSKIPLTVATDGQKILKTPVAVEVLPKKLRFIVGKNRIF